MEAMHSSFFIAVIERVNIAPALALKRIADEADTSKKVGSCAR